MSGDVDAVAGFHLNWLVPQYQPHVASTPTSGQGPASSLSKPRTHGWSLSIRRDRNSVPVPSNTTITDRR